MYGHNKKVKEHTYELRTKYAELRALFNGTAEILKIIRISWSRTESGGPNNK